MTTRNEKDKEHLAEVVIGPLIPIDVKDALEVLARGLLDNPNPIAAFGGGPSLRLVRLTSFFESLHLSAQWEALVARDGKAEIVGVMTMMGPGRCGLSWGHEPPLVRDHAHNPETDLRISQWLEAWSDREPDERHWHLGPMAVEPQLQGRGIGSELLRVVCAQMDAGRESAYLETDKVQNVGFYERFDFEVLGERTVLGATNWFMIRRPHAIARQLRGGKGVLR